MRRVISFYSIALGLAALALLAVPWIGEGALILTMLTPTIAALTMLLWLAPEGGGLFRALGLNRAGLAGWPLALAGPFGLHLLAITVLGLSGLAVFALPAGGLLATIPDLFIGLVIGTFLGLFEEIGWRGYMLPRMVNLGAAQAMLLVGFLHGAWHLPLLLGTDLYHPGGSRWLVVPLFLVTLTLAGVFYGYLRASTGSVWPVAIAHGAVNTAWAVFVRTNQTHTPQVEEILGGESGLIVIAVLLAASIVLALHMRRPSFVNRLAVGGEPVSA